MQFEAVVATAEPAEQVIARASELLERLGYKRVSSEPLTYRRGSTRGSWLAFSIRKWPVVATVTELPHADEGETWLHVLLDIDTTGQSVVQGELARWQGEWQGLLQAMSWGNSDGTVIIIDLFRRPLPGCFAAWYLTLIAGGGAGFLVWAIARSVEIGNLSAVISALVALMVGILAWRRIWAIRHPQPRVTHATDADLDSLVRAAQAMAERSATGQVVYITPERTLVPLDIAPTIAPENLAISQQNLARLAPTRESWLIVGVTTLKGAKDLARWNKLYAFAEYLQGLAGMGHTVLLCEGEEALLARLCHDADLFIADVDALAALPPTTLPLVLEQMGKPRLLVLHQGGFMNLFPLSYYRGLRDGSS